MHESPVGDAVERLGARIRAERRDQGLSVTELSELSGVGRGTVTDLERTMRTPSLDTLAKIASGLGVPMPDLFQERGSGDPQLLAPSAGLESRLIGSWEEEDTRVEVYRLRITSAVRSRACRKGVRGYLTVVAGSLKAGAAGTPRTLTTGGQLAYAADQPHVFLPVGGAAQAVLVMREPLEPRSGDGDGDRGGDGERH